MSAAKHTPGPWHLFDELTICAKDNGSVAFAYGPSFPERSQVGREAMANARLIAAAPDLLAALHRVAALNPDAGEIGAGMLRIIVGEARAAIAKATGGAQ